MKHVSLVFKEEKETVNALRVAEYQRAKGFTVNPRAVQWNGADDQATILGAYDDGALVATMRVEVVERLELVEKKIECPWSYPVRLEMPVMITGKSATRWEHRGSGLNTLLRYWSILLARQWGIRHTVMNMVDKSPRQNSLREMGYLFYPHPNDWSASDYHYDSEVVVGMLDLERHFPTALEACRRQIGDTIKEFTWLGISPEKKIVQVVR